MASLGELIRTGAYDLLKKAGGRVAQSFGNITKPASPSMNQTAAISGITQGLTNISNPGQSAKNLVGGISQSLQNPPDFRNPPASPTSPNLSPYVNMSTPSGKVYAPPPNLPNQSFAPNQSFNVSPPPEVKSPTPLVPSTPTPTPTPEVQGASITASPASSISIPSSVQPSSIPGGGGLSGAELAYQNALQISPEELSTQEDLDKLIEATKKGYLGTENKVIPLEFITGQLAAQERRATSLAEPLERKLARLQASRTASLEASKFGLERADKQVESAESTRRFGVEQAGAAEGRQITRESAAASKAQAERSYSLQQQQFEEDKRQFGLKYALDQRETSIKESESKAKTGTPGEITPESGQALQLVNELIPRVDEISGIGRLGGFTGAKDKLTQLTSILSLNARQLIKGSGAVSDYEARILRDSTNSLSGGYWSGRLSQGFVEQELKKIKGVINANSGIPVEVIVTDPKSRESEKRELTREEIFDAASQGYIIKYE